jgi:hypothetical protein
MQASQWFGNQMGMKFLGVLSVEHGIGDDGEYFSSNDAQLDLINVY